MIPASPGPDLIRSATLIDIEAVQAIEQLCFTPAWRYDNFLAALSDLFLVYERHQQVLGYLIACACCLAKKATIMRLAVHPEARRQGIASRLLQEAITILQRQGLKLIELDVEVAQAGAQQLYQKFGFQTLKVIAADSSYENDAYYLMQLRLVS